MKSIKNRKIILTFLLLLIAFNNIAETSFISRASRSRRTKSLAKSKAKTNTNTKVKGHIQDILNAIKEIPSGPGRIPFILGFLNAFFSVEDMIDSVMAIKERFVTCSNSFQEVPATVRKAELLVTNNPNKSEVKDALEKKEFCLKTKQQLKDTYERVEQAKAANMSWGGTLLGYVSSVASSIGLTEEQTIKVCQDFDEKNEKIFEKDFGNYENYARQCSYFATKNCNDYDLHYEDLMGFVTKAYGFADSITTFADCAHAILTRGGDLGSNEKLQDFANVLKDIKQFFISGLINLGLHIITFGLWGTIKAAYYYVSLMEKIRDFRIDAEDVQMTLGTIVGQACLIVKSLILGRRRKLKLRK
mgnify:CR=1 FL=1